MNPRQLLNEEDEKDIVDKLKSTKLYKRVYQEVLSKVEAQSCFKSLRNIGKHEISNAIENPDQDVSLKGQKARLCYSKIKVLAAALDDAMQNIIKEQFQNSSFLNEATEEILKFIIEKQSSAPPEHSVNKNCVSGMKKENEVEAKDVVENFDKTPPQHSHNNCVSGMKTEIKLEAEEDRHNFHKANKSSFENFYKGDDSSESFSDISSISSVHTSDLSSFDDEITISSDEETGRKRKKLSLKSAQAIIRKNLKLEKSETDVPKKKMKTHNDATHSKNSSSASQGTTQRSLPPRVRKPNAKYASEDIISPFNVQQKEIEKISMTGNSAKISSVPRKVGRKKKRPPNF